MPIWCPVAYVCNLAVWPWVNHLISLFFSFLLLRMEILSIPALLLTPRRRGLDKRLAAQHSNTRESTGHLLRAPWVSSDAFCQVCGRALHA